MPNWKHCETRELFAIAPLYIRTSRKKSLRGSLRSAMLVLTCPPLSSASKRNQWRKTWDCTNLKHLDAGVTNSWIDMGSLSEGEQQLPKHYLETTKKSWSDFSATWWLNERNTSLTWSTLATQTRCLLPLTLLRTELYQKKESRAFRF